MVGVALRELKEFIHLCVNDIARRIGVKRRGSG